MRDHEGVVKAAAMCFGQQHCSWLELIAEQDARIEEEDSRDDINGLDPSLHSATVMKGSPLDLAAIKNNAFFVKPLLEKFPVIFCGISFMIMTGHRNC